MRYSPFLTCRDAAKLISAELDHELGSLDGVALRMHLRICDACSTVVRQHAMVRRAMRAWRDEVES